MNIMAVFFYKGGNPNLKNKKEKNFKLDIIKFLYIIDSCLLHRINHGIADAGITVVIPYID